MYGLPYGVRNQMGIAHRHLDIAMPHQCRNAADIHSGKGKPRCEGMPHGMENDFVACILDAFTQADFGRKLTNYAEKHLCTASVASGGDAFSSFLPFCRFLPPEKVSKAPSFRGIMPLGLCIPSSGTVTMDACISYWASAPARARQGALGSSACR